MFVSSSSPEHYFQLRQRDYIALSKELTESQGKLGYLTLTSATSYVTSNGVTKEFDSNAALKADILRCYW
jgi:hypothetical protein